MEQIVHALRGYVVPATAGALQAVAGMVLGADGNLWFVDTQQSLIGHVTP